MPKKKSQSSESMMLKMVVNGVTIDYERHTVDGVVTERGLPPGMAPHPTLAQLFNYAFNQKTAVASKVAVKK